MQVKKPFLLFIASIVVLGTLGFSIWYRWNTDQKLAQQRIPELTPSAEFDHGSWLNAVALSPTNPELIVSAGMGDTIIKVWNRNNTDTPMITLTDPDGTNFLAFSLTGESLISRGFWWLMFWDVSSGAKIGVFKTDPGATAVLPDRHLLATATKDVKLWDIRNPKDIKPIVVLPPKMARQPLSHEEARSARHHNETINQWYRVIDFSSDGRWIAAGGSMDDVDWQISRGVVKIWDLQRRQLVKVFPRALPKNVEIKPNKDYTDIRSIKFSPDNRFFATVGRYGYTIWTLPEWHIHCDVPAQTANEPTSFSRDDRTQIGIGVRQPVQFFGDLAFSPDGKMYAVAENRTVTLYAIESVTPIALLKGQKGGGLLDLVNTMTFSQDGSTLVSGGMDGIVRLWDIGGLNEK